MSSTHGLMNFFFQTDESALIRKSIKVHTEKAVREAIHLYRIAMRYKKLRIGQKNGQIPLSFLFLIMGFLPQYLEVANYSMFFVKKNIWVRTLVVIIWYVNPVIQNIVWPDCDISLSIIVSTTWKRMSISMSFCQLLKNINVFSFCFYVCHLSFHEMVSLTDEEFDPDIDQHCKVSGSVAGTHIFHFFSTHIVQIYFHNVRIIISH